MSIFENFHNLGKLKDEKLEYEHPIDELNDTSEDTSEALENKTSINFYFHIIIIFIILAVFTNQLFKLQIVSGSQNQFLAEGNRIRLEEIKSPRGIIFDKNKKPLVKNTAYYSFEIIPADLPKEKKDRIKIYESIKEVQNIDLGKIIDEIETTKLYSIEPIDLKSPLTRDEAMSLEMKFYGTPGVKVDAIPTREYEYKNILSHILGYTGKVSQEELDKDKQKYSMTDFTGKNGLELAYEEYLQGKKGARKVEVDSTGILQRELETLDPISGNDLITTLNLDLQKKTYEVLEAKIKEISKDKDYIKHGAVIVMNPQDGGIISMVNYPSYDNNQFSKGIKQEDYEKLLNNEEKPMLNRSVSGIYPSGSIIKPVIAVAGLDKGVVNEGTSINDPGEIKIGEWSFPDWKNHGMVDIKKAIAESCNTFFYAIGGGWENIPGLGVEGIDEYLEKFGFGKTTNIELTGEEAGTIPTAKWKEEIKGESWYLGDTYHLAIGQGDFLTTPLQMVNAISAIANGGKLYKPHFVSSVLDKDGNTIKEYAKELLSDKLINNNSSIDIVREGMKQAVESGSGSARQLQDLPVSSAGKTGTAQFDASDMKKTHSWFVAFAPYDNPEVAIVVLVEKGGDGFDAAEPIAKDVLNYYFRDLKK